jgi:hypothetical protein
MDWSTILAALAVVIAAANLYLTHRPKRKASLMYTACHLGSLDCIIKRHKGAPSGFVDTAHPGIYCVIGIESSGRTSSIR